MDISQFAKSLLVPCRRRKTGSGCRPRPPLRRVQAARMSNDYNALCIGALHICLSSYWQKGLSSNAGFQPEHATSDHNRRLPALFFAILSLHFAQVTFAALGGVNVSSKERDEPRAVARDSSATTTKNRERSMTLARAPRLAIFSRKRMRWGRITWPPEGACARK